jgi:hypothetical protein
MRIRIGFGFGSDSDSDPAQIRKTDFSKKNS